MMKNLTGEDLKSFFLATPQFAAKHFSQFSCPTPRLINLFIGEDKICGGSYFKSTEKKSLRKQSYF